MTDGFCDTVYPLDNSANIYRCHTLHFATTNNMAMTLPPLEVVSVLRKDKYGELEVAVVTHKPSGKQYVRKWVHCTVGEEKTLAAVERAWRDGRITKAQRERIVMVGPEPWVHVDDPAPELSLIHI